jgi:hypothetical protein
VAEDVPASFFIDVDACLDHSCGPNNSAAFWRRRDADRMIKEGRAPLPRSSNSGSLFVKEFAAASAPTKAIPEAKMTEVIRALQARELNRRISYAGVSRITELLSVNSARYFGQFQC